VAAVKHIPMYVQFYLFYSTAFPSSPFHMQCTPKKILINQKDDSSHTFFLLLTVLFSCQLQHLGISKSS